MAPGFHHLLLLVFATYVSSKAFERRVSFTPIVVEAVAAGMGTTANGPSTSSTVSNKAAEELKHLDQALSERRAELENVKASLTSAKRALSSTLVEAKRAEKAVAAAPPAASTCPDGGAAAAAAAAASAAAADDDRFPTYEHLTFVCIALVLGAAAAVNKAQTEGRRATVLAKKLALAGTAPAASGNSSSSSSSSSNGRRHVTSTGVGTEADLTEVAAAARAAADLQAAQDAAARRIDALNAELSSTRAERDALAVQLHEAERRQQPPPPAPAPAPEGGGEGGSGGQRHVHDDGRDRLMAELLTISLELQLEREENERLVAMMRKPP